MSLRGKIILMFVGLAILPILGVAAFGARQGSDLAARVTSGIMEESAQRTADELERALAALEEELADFGSTWGVGGAVTEPEAMSTRIAVGGAPIEGFTYVQLVSASGEVLATLGSVPSENVRCHEGFSSRMVQLSAGKGDGRRRVLAGLWLDDLALPTLRGTASPMIFHRDTGAILLAHGCDLGGLNAHASLPRVFDPGSLNGHLRFSDAAGEDWIAGAVTLEERPWIVMTAVPGEGIMGPLGDLQRSYWLFVLALALCTGLAFSGLLGGTTRSLEQLTRAAGRIGEGDLDPWLPPPGRDEVGRLSFAFAQMLDRLRQTIQRVDQEGRLAVVGRLTSYLAHEIRNPLSSIRLNLQTLQRDLRAGRVDDDSADAVRICLHEVDRLAESVNRVLHLGGSGPQEREEIALHDAVSDAARLLAAQAAEAGVVVRLEFDAAADRIRAARGEIKGVFLNLLMNAIEAQPEGGEIRVRSRLTARAGGPTLAVHVRDHGRGIPPDVRRRVFEPFFTTKSQGSGIGLAAAQRTVRELGGDLYLADLPESLPGSEFVVELPLAAREADEREPRSVLLPQWMASAPDGRARAPLVEPQPHGGTT